MYTVWTVYTVIGGLSVWHCNVPTVPGSILLSSKTAEALGGTGGENLYKKSLVQILLNLPRISNGKQSSVILNSQGLLIMIPYSRVEDPNSLNPDLDEAFQVNPNPDPGFWWPKVKEQNIAKILYILFDQKLQFTYP